MQHLEPLQTLPLHVSIQLLGSWETNHKSTKVHQARSNPGTPAYFDLVNSDYAVEQNGYFKLNPVII